MSRIKRKRHDVKRFNDSNDFHLAEGKNRYTSITYLAKAPENKDVIEDRFYVVRFKRRNYWTLFRCPCGCGHVISLSLQDIHWPSWHVTKSKSGRPTLSPSVWQNSGCRSHFWIFDGRVYWCNNYQFNSDTDNYF